MVFSLVSLLLVSNIVFAQEQEIYHTSSKLDAGIVGISAGLLGAGLIIESRRDPITLDKINGLNSQDVWSFDRSSINNFSTSAKDASDIFRDGAYLLPLTLIISGKVRSEYKSILLMYSEVFALNSAVTLFTKEGIGRLRPYAYNTDTPLELKLNATTRRSFFSGHVSHVASLSFFTASVFSDFYPDSHYKYLVWGVAITAPAVTAYLRHKAGSHFPSDVIVGYGVGALVGYFIPKIHRRKAISHFSIYSTHNGLGLAYSIK